VRFQAGGAGNGRESGRIAGPLLAPLLLGLTLFLGNLATPEVVSAETSQVTGLRGADGVRGISGPNPMDGGDGEDGGDAVAIADAPNEPTRAHAAGGSGGRGGTGGLTTLGSTSDGGNGGGSGSGGDAMATAHSVGDGDARASAGGGFAGTVGSGGRGRAPGVNGERGAVGGRGGDAHSEASATFDADLLPETGSNAELDVQAYASGRSGAIGAVSSGRGGNAEAFARGTATGSGADTASHEVRAEAIAGGGNFLADDGSTRAEATGDVTFGHLAVEAEAISRDFNRSGDDGPGLGGDAFATAHGIHRGSVGSLTVEALARVGTSGTDTGSGSIEASGIATEGVDVDVAVRLESAGSSVLRDAVSGSTAGTLRLNQALVAGSSDLAAHAGDVVTSLNATNEGGGNLVADVTAIGGRAPFGETAGGSARIDFVDAVGSQNVYVEGAVSAGAGREGSIGSLRGESTTGGDVEVRARINSASAEDMLVDSVVSGETTGRLILSQQVSSGSHGAASTGNRGRTESRLEYTAQVESFDAYASATGGDARAEVIAENETGSVAVRGRADGGVRSQVNLDGGDAASFLRAVSRGDGNDVTIGTGIFLGRENAIGGLGRLDFPGGVESGDGGDASGVVEGIARGDSAVRVVDFVVGGDGGGYDRRATNGSALGGEGGDASSYGFASNAGSSAVEIETLAAGGDGGRSLGEGNPSGRGGAAVVSAWGESSGGADVTISARALGGRGGQAGVSNESSGRGGDAAVENFGGSTSGTLRITASAQSGWPGSEIDGAFRGEAQSGDARVDLDVENEGGGALELTASAFSSYDGLVKIDQMRGASSAGADVTVSLSTGSRELEIAGERQAAGDAIRLENIVKGETTGRLAIEQTIGDVSAYEEVENVLRRTGSHAGLSLASRLNADEDTRAIAIADAENRTGWASAVAEASSEGAVSIADARATGGGLETTSASATADERSASSQSQARTDTVRRATATAIGVGDGDADAYASARSVEGGEVTAIARAQSGGDVEAIAELTASTRDAIQTREIRAEGVSTNGGAVTLRANLSHIGSSEPGEVVELYDVVHGSTSGHLLIDQDITSTASDVATDLVIAHEGEGDLRMEVDAIAKQSFSRFGFVGGGDVFLGDVIGSSLTGADVTVSVGAWGKEVFLQSRDNPDKPSRIHGSSEGGRVSVAAAIGRAGRGTLTPEITEFDGRSIDLHNIVSGETSGELHLFQEAVGGDALIQDSFLVFPPPPGGPETIDGADGGDARSSLSRSGSLERLELEARARGGNGSFVYGQPNPLVGGNGGQAEVDVVARNREGEVETTGTAEGGVGGTLGSGGRAAVRLNAISEGDGNRVQVGTRPEPDPFSESGLTLVGAVGGNGNGAGFSRVPSTEPDVVGAGGDAEMVSRGLAEGDGEVDVYARATGGNGGSGRSSFGVPDTAIGGEGGTATAIALAKGAGQSRVVSEAEAFGGLGGNRIAVGGNGGDAFATSHAVGAGVVESRAVAHGGASRSSGAQAGSARSRSHAVGQSVRSSALASSIVEQGMGVQAYVTSSGSERARSAAIASMGGGLAVEIEPTNTFASIVSLPDAAAVEGARENHAELDAFLSTGNNASAAALASWSAKTGSGEVTEQRIELDIILAGSTDDADLRRDVLLAVFAGEASSGGFDELVFSLEVDGVLVGDEQRFTSLASASSYFAQLIELAGVRPGGSSSPFVAPPEPARLRAIFDVRTSGNQSVSFGLAAMIVPEPGTALLLGLGLAGLARRRRADA